MALVSTNHHCGSSGSWGIRDHDIIVVMFVSHNLPSNGVQLGLKRLRLLLQGRDRTHAPVYGVPDASFCFVYQAACCIGALAFRNLHQHLGYVTGTEDFMHARKLLGFVW
jgi:hypothetical protein